MTGLSLILTTLDELEKLAWHNPGSRILIDTDLDAAMLLLNRTRYVAPLASTDAACASAGGAS